MEPLQGKHWSKSIVVDKYRGGVYVISDSFSHHGNPSAACRLDDRENRL